MHGIRGDGGRETGKEQTEFVNSFHISSIFLKPKVIFIWLISNLRLTFLLLLTTYNKIPFIQKMNPDLDEYVTQRSLNGLFYLVSQEEISVIVASFAVDDVFRRDQFKPIRSWYGDFMKPVRLTLDLP